MPLSPEDRHRVIQALRDFHIHGAQRLSNKEAARRRAIEKAKGAKHGMVNNPQGH